VAGSAQHLGKGQRTRLPAKINQAFATFFHGLALGPQGSGLASKGKFQRYGAILPAAAIAHEAAPSSGGRLLQRRLEGAVRRHGLEAK
jgi:hypothetical protein